MKFKSVVRNLLCTLLSVVLMANPMCSSVLADEVYDGVKPAVSGTFAENLTWTMEDHTLTISGVGDMAFESEFSKDMPWKNYKNKIYSIVIEEGVTSICNYAFFQHSYAREISLPDSLVSIGRDPFDSCGFDSIAIPSNVENISSRAFQNVWTSAINVAEDNQYYASEDGVFFNKNKTTLLRYPTQKEGETYTVPESVREIADHAFYNTRCAEVIISSNVTSIGNGAFFQSALKGISIPASVTRMGTEVFANCWYLESISVDGSNRTYSSDSSGVLFNKNKSTLLLYPMAFTTYSYTVPATVTAIEGKAFAECTLSEITLPEKLESIGAHSFYYCSNLTDVYYAGSEEQWNQIAIDGTGNESLLEAEIHFDVPAYDTEETGEAVTGITLSAPSTYLQMYVGKGVTLTATVFPENAANKNVIWTSSNPSIVSVEDGVLTANLTGSATITATTEDGGFTASCRVIVSVEEITHSGTFNNGNKWTVSSDGVLTISGIGDLVYDEGDEFNPIAPWIDIRSQIKNIVIEEGITSICNSAFVLHNQVQHISLPGTLVSIGESAFESCRWEHVTIPKSVTYIASSAFMDIWAADFTVESGNPYYSSEDGVLFNKDKTVLLRYPSLRTSEEYSIPESVTEIETAAFRDARCTSVELPASVRRIGMEAFSSSWLQSIFIPENVMEIDTGAFNFCYDLQSITVDPDNAVYSSDENGVLFNKAKTMLNRFPAALALDTYTVPETVKGIGPYAFQNSRLSEIVLPQGLDSLNSYAFFACENLQSIELPSTLTQLRNGVFYVASSLESVVIPSGIESIALQTFGDCHSLKSVEIPVSVTSIERRAFDACESLTDIYYHGTEEQWNAIIIDSDSNDPLFAAKIHFNSTMSDPEEPAKGDFESVENYGDIDYTVEEKTITVEHDIACKVGYLSGDHYVVIEAIKNEDGTYSFEAPVDAKDVVMVVKGDVNLDGKVSLADSTRTKAYANRKIDLPALELFAGNVNGDAKVSLADSTKLKAVANHKTALSW